MMAVFSLVLLTSCSQGAHKIINYSIDENNNIIVKYDDESTETIGKLNEDDIAGLVKSVSISDDGYYIIDGIKTNIKASNIYTVKFDTNYSANVPNQNIAEGRKVQRPELNRTGYVLEGWFCNGEEWRFNSDVVLNDMTLSAQWRAKQTELIFNSDGGSEVENVVVTFDSPYSLPTPQKNLYTFLGWEFNSSFIENSGLWDLDTAEQIKLTAVWARTTHFITFDSNGGEAVDCLEVNSFTEIDELPIPTWDDHFFMGWTIDDEPIEYPLFMEDSDIALVASWKEVSEVFEFKEDIDGTMIIEKFIGDEIDVVVPEKITQKTVTTIAKDAFVNGSNVKKLKLGLNLTNLEYRSLYGCSNLEELTISGLAKYNFEYYFGNTNNSNDFEDDHIPSSLKTIIFTEGGGVSTQILGEYTAGAHLFKVIVPPDISYSPSFNRCLSIEEVVLPESVTSIRDNAFYNACNLKKVNIPQFVSKIGEDAFYGCDKLSYLIVPSSVQTFGRRSLSAKNAVILLERTEKITATSVFGYEDEMDIFYGFKALKTNDTFEYALCKVGSKKQAIILSLVEGATKPETMPTELDGYPVVLSKV